MGKIVVTEEADSILHDENKLQAVWMCAALTVMSEYNLEQLDFDWAFNFKENNIRNVFVEYVLESRDRIILEFETRYLTYNFEIKSTGSVIKYNNILQFKKAISDKYELDSLKIDLITSYMEIEILKKQKSHSQERRNAESTVAISYAQDGDAYNNKVMGFVNLLRGEYGYEAIMDQLLKQEHTAIDFNEMMSKLILNSNKVIVVLSRKYKRKAEEFTGGVGKEYRIILDEIDNKTNKYIFITFDSLDDINIEEIKPANIGNREILDFSEGAEQWNELLSKLSGTPIYQFSDVAREKKKPKTKKIAFVENKMKENIYRNVRIILSENRQLLEQYGPNSLNAINNPLSSAVNMWKKIKIDTIIPNNRKIIDEFESNITLFSLEEIQIFKKYKIHAEAFEACQNGYLEADAAPVFPKEFEMMIFKEED